MRDRWPMVLAATFIAAVVAWIVVAVVMQVKWTNKCHDAGGWVEQRYEYSSIDMTYMYDSKGNITAVIPTVTQHYSFHCWVNHQEVSV
jgi:hypothetical protein